MNQLVDSLIFRLREYFNPERLGPPLAELIVDLSIAAIIMVIFYLIWRFVSGLVLPRWKRYLDRTSAAFVETLIKFGILSLGVLAALSAAGIQTTAVLTSLGVVGLTIGFAARDTLSNIISGILIFIDRPFTIMTIMLHWNCAYGLPMNVCMCKSVLTCGKRYSTH